MNHTDIAKARMISQQIGTSQFLTVKELVSWMGALQAQDYSAVKWAIGLRIPGTTQKDVDEAVRKGEIIRTHLMRPTWHFVSAGDLQWMLDLTAPRIRASLKGRHRQLGLTEALIAKSHSLIEKALEGWNPLTRDALRILLEKAGIDTGENRLSHLLLCAELDGLVCSGPDDGKKLTYALVRERVPEASKISREEGLARLALRYFSSHGPATLQDFTWWSGVTLNDAKRSVEMIKREIFSETFWEVVYYFSDISSAALSENKQVFLLPPYDEFIISYKDRSPSIPAGVLKKAVSDNGIFRPVILVNGRVTGTWSRVLQHGMVWVQPSFFREPGKAGSDRVSTAVLEYGRFLDMKAALVTIR